MSKIVTNVTTEANNVQVVSTTTTSATAVNKEKEAMLKAAASSQTTTVEATSEVPADTNVVNEEVTVTDQQVTVNEAAGEEAVTEGVITGDTAVSDESAVTEETTTGEAAVTEESVAEETTVSEGISADEAAKEAMVNSNVDVQPIMKDGSYVDPGYETGMAVDPTMGMGGTEVKDSLLSSWLFVIGISAAVLFVSVALGAFLARRKIKKGIELYED